MKNLFPIHGFDHLELYVGNAKQSAQFYVSHFGFSNTAYRGLESGYRKVASYLLEQGDIRLLLTTALSADHPIASWVQKHGDGVGVIAFAVPDAQVAYHVTTARGAKGVIPPTAVESRTGALRYAAIQAYGDILFKFVERRNFRGLFEPGFIPTGNPNCQHAGLTRIDHVVANVEKGRLDFWSQFLAETMGFELLMQFDETMISTAYSALSSKVMQDASGKIKLPINEPAPGKRTSQIQEFLDYNHGPGIQHIACYTDNIIQTVAALKASGVQFLNIPQSYYATLRQRVGPIEEPVALLEELGILVDRDQWGYLLQIFTKPLQDRPTLFFEIIERHGSQGFGEGNFKSLFEAIEREQEQRGNL